MTLLSITNDVADEVSIDRPATIAGNASVDAQRLLRLVNKVGKKLMKVAPWQVLRKEQTFTSVAAEEQTGILPSDFDRFIPETFFDRTGQAFISGPITPVEWQGFKASGYNGTQKKFVYRGDSIFILPAFGAGSTLAFEYVSKNWCQSSGGTGQTAFAADDDTGILDEELLTLATIFVYLDAEGQPTASAAREFEDYANTLLGNDQPNAGILTAGDIFGNGRHFSGTPTLSATALI